MQTIKVIVAGGRDFEDYEMVKTALDYFFKGQTQDIEIVSGRCSTGVHTFTTDDNIYVYGADGLGERYAKENNLEVAPFPADWSKGKSAGYTRNKQMAYYAGYCFCFWDEKSKGTKLMIDLAKQNNLTTFVYTY